MKTSQIRVFKEDLARVQELQGRYRSVVGHKFSQQQLIQLLLDKAFDGLKEKDLKKGESNYANNE